MHTHAKWCEICYYKCPEGASAAAMSYNFRFCLYFSDFVCRTEGGGTLSGSSGFSPEVAIHSIAALPFPGGDRMTRWPQHPTKYIQSWEMYGFRASRASSLCKELRH